MLLQLIQHWLINYNNLIEMFASLSCVYCLRTLLIVFLKLNSSAFEISNPQFLPAFAADADKKKPAATCNCSLQLLVSHNGTGDDAPLNAKSGSLSPSCWQTITAKLQQGKCVMI